MVSHYTLQTKDHKFAVKEQDFSVADMEMLKTALMYYHHALERSYEHFYVEDQMPDVANSLKERIEKVRLLRSKLNGND